MIDPAKPDAPHAHAAKTPSLAELEKTGEELSSRWRETQWTYSF